MPDPLPPSILLDLHELAALLACSRRHIRRLHDSKRIPQPIRIGRLLRWRRAEIEKWISDGCRPVPGGGGGAK